MKKQAILMIDMQKGLVLGAYRQDELVATVNGLIAGGRTAEVPVVFVQHNHATFEPMMRGSRGWEIYPELDRRADDPVVEKEACDAFCETDLDATLKDVVRHHNAVLANIVHPSAKIRVLPAGEVPIGR